MTSFEPIHIHCLCQLPPLASFFQTPRGLSLIRSFCAKRCHGNTAGKSWLQQTLIHNAQTHMAARIPPPELTNWRIAFPNPPTPPGPQGFTSHTGAVIKVDRSNFITKRSIPAAGSATFKWLDTLESFKIQHGGPRYVGKSSRPFGLMWIFSCLSLDLWYRSSWCGNWSGWLNEGAGELTGRIDLCTLPSACLACQCSRPKYASCA